MTRSGLFITIALFIPTITSAASVKTSVEERTTSGIGPKKLDCHVYVGDYVWFDEDGQGDQDASENGINGVTLRFYKQNYNGTWNHIATQQTYTRNGRNGYYRFFGSDYGTFKVVIDESTVPSGYQRTYPGGISYTVEYNSSHGSELVYYDADFGYYKEAPAPSIDIEKHTNGQDADNAPGPSIQEGNAVTWAYIVTNTGNVTLTGITVTDDHEGSVSLPATSLAPGASATGYLYSTASAGQYANEASVSGFYGQAEVTDTDPSHYVGAEAPAPSIDIEKHTNGRDADLITDPDVPSIQQGNAVTWAYIVTNIGNVTLTGISVDDDIENDVTMPKTTLEPGEHMKGFLYTTASAGQYANQGTVSGFYGLTEVRDADSSHYIGTQEPAPAIDIEKHTNGQDADLITDPDVPSIQEGNAVTWAYIVTNTGNVDLEDIEVIDDIEGNIDTIGFLAAGEDTTLIHTGTAMLGHYANQGTVEGYYRPLEIPVTDSDSSHYTGTTPKASISDFVWIDSNNNGIQDTPEEFGLNGVVVLLFPDRNSNGIAEPGGADGPPIDSRITTENGYYIFSDLAPGSYFLQFLLPSGWEFTSQYAGGNTVKDSNANPNSGVTDVTDLSGGDNDVTFDAGVVEITVASIADFVWNDLNQNGIQDAGEPGIPDVTVLLYMDLDGDGIAEPGGDDAPSLASTQTDAAGWYAFTNLAPGDYFLVFDLMAGYQFSPRFASNIAKDSNADPASGITDIATLESGENELTWDAGMYFTFVPNPEPGRRYLVARYQPWYGSASSDSTLRHWAFDYMGGQADTSIFNGYESRFDEKLWEYHILLAWACGIDGFAVDWYGRHSFETPGMKGLLDKADELYNLYNDKGFNFEIAASYNEKSAGELDNNFLYLADSIIVHPAYWGVRRLTPRPVFTFNTDAGLITAADYRSAADTTMPPDVYLLWNGTEPDVFDPMDVLYPWVQPLPEWGPSGLNWGESYLDTTYWRMNNIGEPGDLLWAMGGVWPGHDDRAWSLSQDHFIDRQDTSVYNWTWEKVHNYNYSLPMHMALIETWNDLNQATEIEPSVEWDYKFNVLTRDHARRFKGSLDPDSVGVENLGLLVPQHVHQARIAAELRPAEAVQIEDLIQTALTHFFNRDHLSALSAADQAAGLAPKQVSVDETGDGFITISWPSAAHGNAYNVYYATDPAAFAPCAFEKPAVIYLGDVNAFTLTGIENGLDYWIAVTAVDTTLGAFANESWYESNITGAHIVHIQPIPAKTTEVADHVNGIPETFALYQNYPNPFNPETVIQYDLPKAQNVSLAIYDIRGRLVETLVSEHQNAGYHQVRFPAGHLTSGVYIYRLVTDEFSRVNKLVLQK